VAFFPVLSNTTLGLNSVDRNLAGLFQLYGASRLQTLRYLKLPAALPYISAAADRGGLSLIGAVVPRSRRHGGRGLRIGLPNRRIRLPPQHSRMFAALFCSRSPGLSFTPCWR